MFKLLYGYVFRIYNIVVNTWFLTTQYTFKILNLHLNGVLY